MIYLLNKYSVLLFLFAFVLRQFNKFVRELVESFITLSILILLLFINNYRSL
jgi:hypothetical protein